MFHSVTINGKNTWDDYHMIPANGIYLPPPPEQKRTTIDLKTGNGLLDVSTVLTGYPLFQNRSGELQYFILDPWDLEEQGIGGNWSIQDLETRVRKHFSGSTIDNFFNEINTSYNSNWDTSKILMAVIGTAETDTAITLWRFDNAKEYIYDHRLIGSSGGAMNFTSLVTKGTGCKYDSYYLYTSAWSNYYTFNFDNVTTSGGTNYNNLVLPTTDNVNNTVSGQTCIWSRDIYASQNSDTIVYPKTLVKKSSGFAAHTMPDPYDVYSQLLADIHGKTGTMIFEDDPNWYYQGNFTVRSMETNAIRRAVSIGYEVAPYKIKTSSITQTTTSVNSSSWTTFTYSADDIGSMPVHPKVRVTSLPSGGSLSVKFTSPSNTGTAITKTITDTGDHTWADVIVYNNSLTISYLGSADSGYNVTHIITPGRL